MHDVERELRDLGERVGREVTHGAVPARRIVRKARLRRTLAVSVPTVAVIVVAALAVPAIDWERRGPSNPVAAGFLESAAAATEDAGTARTEFEMTLDFGGRASAMRSVGVVDFENGASRFTMEASGPERSGVAEVIYLGTTLYQRIVEPSHAATEKWHRREIDLPTRSAGAFGVSGTGPAEILSSLRAISSEVVEVAREELDGVPVTRYRVTIDPNLMGMGGLSDGVEIELDPMEVWVDEADRVRKLTWAMSSSSGDEPGSEADTQVTMRLWDFGVPVEIAAPPPEEVTDAPLPESAFGSPISGAISSGESSSRSDSFGIDSSFTVVGDAGASGPHVFVTFIGEPAMCITRLHRSTTRATLVDAERGQTVVTVDDQKLRSSLSHHSTGGACATPETGPDVFKRLERHPDAYELRVERRDGSVEIVRLTETLSGDG